METRYPSLEMVIDWDNRRKENSKIVRDIAGEANALKIRMNSLIPKFIENSVLELLCLMGSDSIECELCLPTIKYAFGYCRNNFNIIAVQRFYEDIDIKLLLEILDEIKRISGEPGNLREVRERVLREFTSSIGDPSSLSESGQLLLGKIKKLV